MNKYYIRRTAAILTIFGIPGILLFCKLYTLMIHFLWALGLR